LEQDDLFKLSYEDSSAGVYKQFSKFWKKQLAKSPLYKANKKGSPNAQNPDVTTAKRASTPSLAIALFRAFGGPFAGAGFLKLIHDSLIFVGPLALNKLIFILSDPTQPLSLGLFYVAAIFFSNFFMFAAIFLVVLSRGHAAEISCDDLYLLEGSSPLNSRYEQENDWGDH
jgi:hypothetical protein